MEGSFIQQSGQNRNLSINQCKFCTSGTTIGAVMLKKDFSMSWRIFGSIAQERVAI